MSAAHDTKALAACPFCGSQNVTVSYEGQPASTICCACADCGAMGPSVGVFQSREPPSVGWNRRAALASRLQEKEGQPALAAFGRECLEIANALKGEYGTIKAHRGIAHFDFSEHVYAGRAGALLRRAATLAAGSQAVQVPGWKLVPIEPTEAMLDEGAHHIYEPTNRNDLERVWSAMLDAAPLQPLAGGEVTNG